MTKIINLLSRRKSTGPTKRDDCQAEHTVGITEMILSDMFCGVLDGFLRSQLIALPPDRVSLCAGLVLTKFRKDHGLPDRD